MKFELVKSDSPGKKYKAVFTDGTKHKTIHFGAEGMSDYIHHKNEDRKNAYIARHQAREDWTNPMTAGALSRWILWNKTTLSASVSDFKRRFHLD